jgi:hypothetical protein
MVYTESTSNLLSIRETHPELCDEMLIVLYKIVMHCHPTDDPSPYIDEVCEHKVWTPLFSISYLVEQLFERLRQANITSCSRKKWEPYLYKYKDVISATERAVKTPFYQ